MTLQSVASFAALLCAAIAADATAAPVGLPQSRHG